MAFGAEWTRMVTLAIIGDIHMHFDAVDVEYFNRSDCDLLLFVGDLAREWPPHIRRIARCIARLQKPALLIPGNHDVPYAFQSLAEHIHWQWLARLFGPAHVRHHERLGRWLQAITMCGYSVHPFAVAGLNFAVVAGRPFARGGSELSFAPFLLKQFGVRTVEDSTELMKQRIDQAPSECLIFLAHNGPHGLGDQPTDIWGCDFDPRRGDYGDRDLTIAIEYAKSRGKQVLAVVAGHLHLRTKQEQQRLWHVQRDGTHYINAARVPRNFNCDGKQLRHYIRLSLSPTDVTVTELLV
jgi:uncharacterized protein (TIGR04168 family)